MKAAGMFSFDVRRNPKAPNGVKSNALQNGYLGFLLFFDFDPKKSKFRFFAKLLPIKSEVFKLSQKRYICNRDTHNAHTKFQSNIFFGCAMAKKKHVKAMTSRF